MGVWGSGVKFVKFLGSPVNRLIRLKYVRYINSLDEEIKVLRNAGKNSEEIASFVVNARNILKEEARALMITEGGLVGKGLVKILKLRNYCKYQHSVGPTVEWFIARGYTYEEIIDSTLRSSETINRFMGVF